MLTFPFLKTLHYYNLNITYLILHVDESLNYIFKKWDVNLIEKNITDIIINELDAEKDNCQIIWVKSKIFNSNYKLYGEIKFREKKSRDVNKRESCLKKIGDILKNEFNVFIRLRTFSIKEAYITALD